MNANQLNEYMDSWVQKRIDYEMMAKGRAKLNAYCWRKLRNYHLQNYVKRLDNPFGFLFTLKYKRKDIAKNLPSLNTLYVQELRKRQENFMKMSDRRTIR